jgi:2'-5' RNA ligase
VAKSDRPWRCFVAVPIDTALREALAAITGDLRGRPGAEAWRWTDADGWHVTLAFLGATDPAAVPRLASALVTVAGAHPPVALAAGGLGAFPSRTRARVLWYGVADPHGALRRLAHSVADACGLAADGRFRGHLTLARVRDRDGTDAAALVEAPTEPATLRVDRLVLFRSHLGRGPARYEAIATAALRGGSP